MMFKSRRIYMSDFLNNLFRGYDYAILSFLHNLASNAKGFFTPFATIISFITEKGLIFIILAIILMLFKKTRKIGICMFGTMGIKVGIAYHYGMTGFCIAVQKTFFNQFCFIAVSFVQICTCHII